MVEHILSVNHSILSLDWDELLGLLILYISAHMLGWGLEVDWVWLSHETDLFWLSDLRNFGFVFCLRL